MRVGFGIACALIEEGVEAQCRVAGWAWAAVPRGLALGLGWCQKIGKEYADCANALLKLCVLAASK